MLSVTNGCTLLMVLVWRVCDVAGQSVAPQPPSSPEGLRLLQKMQDALGGAKRIAAVHDFEEIIRAEARDANGAALGEVRKRTRWIKTPNVVRLDQIGQCPRRQGIQVVAQRLAGHV